MKRIKFLFAWYDFWIGVFVDKPKKKIYIFPLPMLGIVIDYSSRKLKEILNYNYQLAEDIRIKKHIDNKVDEIFNAYMNALMSGNLFMRNPYDECTMYEIHHFESARWKDVNISDIITSKFNERKMGYTKNNT